MKLSIKLWLPVAVAGIAACAFGQDYGDFLVFPRGGHPYLEGADAKTRSVETGIGQGRSFTVRLENFNTFVYKMSVTVSSNTLFADVPDEFKNYAVKKTPAPAEAPGGEAIRGTAAFMDDLRRVEAAETIVQALGELGTRIEGRVKGVATQTEAKQLASEVSSMLEGFKDKLNGNALRLYPNRAAAATMDEYAVAAAVKEALGWVENNAKTIQANLIRIEAMQIVEPDAGIRAGLVDLATTYRQAVESMNKLQADRQAILDSVESMLRFVGHARAADYMTTTKGPFRAEGDEVTVTYTATSIKNKDDVEEGKAVLHVNSGSKIDFSGGIIFTSLADMTYKNVGTAQSPVRKGVSTDGRVAFGSFAHYYFRDLGEAKLGFSLGIALDDKPIYMVGLSLLMGRSQRIVLTGGLALGKVARFDSFDEEANPVTRDVYQKRFFMGLSWNF